MLTSQAQNAESTVISPDFAFEHAWKYQEMFGELQGDINLTIQQAITAISTVLGSSTKTTLEQYREHMDNVYAFYLPFLELISGIQHSTCKIQAETILEQTTEFTGFAASVCASKYDVSIGSEIAAANGALARFDDLYSQVQTIIVKAFVKQNAFVTPEDIKDNITKMFALMEDKWAAAKPDIEAIRLNLASRVAALNAELASCHRFEETQTVQALEFGRSRVQTCEDFNNSSNPLAQKSRAGYSALEEFEAFVATLKPYEWQL